MLLDIQGHAGIYWDIQGYIHYTGIVYTGTLGASRYRETVSQTS